MLLHQDGNPAENFATLDDGGRSPGRLRLLRTLDGGVHISGARTRHTAALATGRRIHLRKRAVVGGATVVAAHLIRNIRRDREINTHVVTSAVRSRPLAYAISAPSASATATNLQVHPGQSMSRVTDASGGAALVQA